MAFFGEKVSILFAIYVTLCIAVTNGLRTQQWTRDFGSSVFDQDQSLLTSPGQVYGNCEPKQVDMDTDKFKTSCKFAMENADAAIDLPDHVRMCNFTLTKDIPQSNKMYMLEEIVAVAKEKAVLRFAGHSSQIIFVLNFADCTVAHSYTDNNFMYIHAPSNSKFDVIILKDKDPEVKHRIIFNTDGNVISSEQHWFKSNTNIIAAADSPTKGRLVIDVIRRFSDNSLKPAVRIIAVANDGSVKNLKEYPIDNRGFFAHWERFAESTTFNLVSLCARSNSTTSMKCSQLDLDGNVKFETEISLDEYSPVHSFRLHNLPRGGLLLFIFKCRETVKPVCVLREQSFIVKKIDAAGQSVAALKVNDNFNVTSVKKGVMHVFESDKKEVCLSNVRSRSNDWDLTLDVVCLKDNDFSGEITWPVKMWVHLLERPTFDLLFYLEVRIFAGKISLEVTNTKFTCETEERERRVNDHLHGSFLQNRPEIIYSKPAEVL